jgi:hypothetical protein
MNRNDLQALSRLRLREAKVLLDNDCFEGAYYLAGYAVECALKACIAKQIKRYDFPDKKVVTDSYSHDIVKLIQVSGLKAQHDIEMRNPAFALNWAIVKDWSEQVRYSRSISRIQTQDLYSAITVRRNGVMPWLRKWW